MSTFLNAAVDLASHGFYLIPLKPRDKWPIVAGGFKAATRDPEQIALWWKRNPDANIGIACEASGLCVMDCDHGLTCYEDFTAWRDRNGLPPTYAVRSGRRPEFGVQMYYRGPIATSRWELDGCSGDIKSTGGLVVAPPSIHPDSGEAYAVLEDLPITPTPEVVKQLKKVVAERTEAGGIDTDNRNQEMCSFIGTIRKHTADMGEPECLVICLTRNDRYTKGPMPEEEVKEIVSKQYRLYPDVGPDPVVRIGGPKTPGVDVEVVEELDPELKSTPLPKYPIESFEDTIYLDFAKRAAEGNYVPLEFFVEGAMTYAGAIAALNVRHKRSEEITPRLYTVLLASAGIGKGTTFRRIRKFAPSHRILDDVSPENSIPKNCSALLARPASENGLNEALLKHAHVLLEFEEMDRLMEKTRIEGSGGALMSIIRTCFDDIRPGITTCKGREVAAEAAFLSLLGAMTPSLWRRAMEGRDSYGSGLGGRFNLIASNEDRTASTLLNMSTGDLDARLEKIFSNMEYETTVIDTDLCALKLLEQWWKDNSRGKPHYNRVNVIAHRKALHLAWIRGLPVITAEIMQQALRLADYLVGVRDVFAVSKGDDKTAIGENKILHVLRQINPKAVTSKQLVDFLDGAMSRASVFRALDALVSSGEAEKHLIRRPGCSPYGVFRVKR